MNPSPFFQSHNGTTLGRTRTLVKGTGEMAELVRAHDWSSTPLGPIESWSEALLTMVNVVLSYPRPAVVDWGAEMTMIYNDEYETILGDRHPEALGQSARQVWKDAWYHIGPQYEAVLSLGGTTVEHNVLIPLEKDGRMEDFFWDYTLTPVNEGEQIAGIFITCQNATEAVLIGRDRDRIAERLKQVLEVTTDAVAVLDREWRFTYLNKRGQEILQASEDVLGRDAWEAFPAMVYEGSPYVYHYHRAMDEGLAGEFGTEYPEPLNISLQIKAAL